MERAVFIADLDRLPPPGVPFDRLYLGSEFCHRRLPSPPELERALDVAARRGAAFTLVTPFLDEEGLAETLELVRELPDGGGTEVVANDVGLVEALAETGWDRVVVAGRLLARQRRGPGFREPRTVSPGALAALRASSLDSRAFVAWLGSTFGIARFELDDLAQGLSLGPLPDGVRVSLYRPWLLLTATRNCPWVFDGRTWEGARTCARPCRGRALVLEPEGGGRTILLGGRAQFLRAEGGHGLDGPIPPGVDRVVDEPDIPA